MLTLRCVRGTEPCFVVWVSLKEQFGVVSIQNTSKDGKERTVTGGHHEKKAPINRVLAILMRRLQSTKAFGENLIFMLNRTGIPGCCFVQFLAF